MYSQPFQETLRWSFVAAAADVELIEIAESVCDEAVNETTNDSTWTTGASVSAAPLRAIPTPFGRRHDQPVAQSKSTARTDDVSGSSQLPPLPDLVSHEIVPHQCVKPNDRDWTCTFDAEGKVPLWDKDSIKFLNSG